MQTQSAASGAASAFIPEDVYVTAFHTQMPKETLSPTAAVAIYEHDYETPYYDECSSYVLEFKIDKVIVFRGLGLQCWLLQHRHCTQNAWQGFNGQSLYRSFIWPASIIPIRKSFPLGIRKRKLRRSTIQAE
jgi:hypothetical protein